VNARRVLLALPALLLIGDVAAPVIARADTRPDVLSAYAIAVTPQPDGMLTMTYTLTGYKVESDWPASEPYLQIGVPNGNFSITNFGSDGTVDVSNAEMVETNGSFVQFDFGTLPRTGDTFDLHFTIDQGGMAYRDTGADQIDYDFVPAGWTFPIVVDEMTVSWADPADPSQLALAEPSPQNDGTTMTWDWTSPSIDASGMFDAYAIQIDYQASAFDVSDAASAQSNGENGSGSGSYDNSGSSGDSSGALVGLFIVAMFVLAFVQMFRGDQYGGGPGFRAGTGVYHSGFSHACACACAGCACACACACAGGGRVGCSRKAIGIACLPRVVRSMTGSRAEGEVAPS